MNNSMEQSSSIKIQKVYKGYYVRKKLNHFYNLPRDLQRKIIWHINKDIYNRHFNCSIAKLIYRKYNTFYSKEYNKKVLKEKKNYIFYITENNKNNVNYKNHTEFKEDLRHLVTITLKYSCIINFKKIECANKIKSYILKCFVPYLQNVPKTDFLKVCLYEYCRMILIYG